VLRIGVTASGDKYHILRLGLSDVDGSVTASGVCSTGELTECCVRFDSTSAIGLGSCFAPGSLIKGALKN
jgi:hypothetical protein